MRAEILRAQSYDDAAAGFTQYLMLVYNGRKRDIIKRGELLWAETTSMRPTKPTVFDVSYSVITPTEEQYAAIRKAIEEDVRRVPED